MIKELITNNKESTPLSTAHYYINRTLLKSVNEFIYPKHLDKDTEQLFIKIDNYLGPYRAITNKRILKFIKEMNYKFGFSIKPRQFSRLVRLLYLHSKYIDQLEYRDIKKKAVDPIKEYRESREKAGADIKYALNSHIRKLPDDSNAEELKELASELNSKINHSSKFITQLEKAIGIQRKHSNTIMKRLNPNHKPQEIDILDSKIIKKLVKPIVNTQTFKEYIFYTKDIIFEGKQTNWSKFSKFIMLSKKEFPFMFKSLPEEITALDTTYFQNTYENYNRRQKRPSLFELEF